MKDVRRKEKGKGSGMTERKIILSYVFMKSPSTRDEFRISMVSFFVAL